jgi:uncharacterized protein (DUF1501 family)
VVSPAPDRPHSEHGQTTRREFLKLSSKGMGAITLGSLFPSILPTRLFGAGQKSQGTAPILVLVQLAGGNDGLNTTIPYSNDRYYRLRPTIALPENEILPLTDTIGLHPACRGLEKLYQSGDLAIVQGVGYPNPNRSHFGSEAIWATAGNSEHTSSTGWVGRYLDNNPPEFTLRPEPIAVHFSHQTPRCLLGEETSEIYGFEVTGEDGLPVYHNGIVSSIKSYRASARYPDTRFGANLKKIAAMISARYSTRIYHVTLGGFDTHFLQSIPHHNLLTDLSGGLAAFQEDLHLHGQDSSVLTMTYSEFGRRAGENERHGTDHGTSAPLFILGRHVAGGIYGEPPRLPTNRYEDMDYQIDFRTVYSTVLENWLGAPTDQILDHKSEPLEFI